MGRVIVSTWLPNHVPVLQAIQELGLALHVIFNRAAVWFRRLGTAPFSMSIIPGNRDRIRHRRKYAEGNMRHNSFYFRGVDARQNLKAQNLTVFSQLAEGVDEETWLFHLYRGDYSRWFRDAVKDPYLADQTERIEQRSTLCLAETRNLIRRLIDSRYAAQVAT